MMGAHRAGKADEELLRKCPSLGLKLDNEVAIDTKTSEKCSLALVGYVHMVFNRFLESESYKPLKITGMGMFQDEFDKLFPNAVKSHLTKGSR